MHSKSCARWSVTPVAAGQGDLPQAAFWRDIASRCHTLSGAVALVSMLMCGALWGVPAPPEGQTPSAVVRVREHTIGNDTACVVVVRLCRISVGAVVCRLAGPFGASVSAGSTARGQAWEA